MTQCQKARPMPRSQRTVVQAQRSFYSVNKGENDVPLRDNPVQSRDNPAKIHPPSVLLNQPETTLIPLPKADSLLFRCWEEPLGLQPAQAFSRPWQWMFKRRFIAQSLP